MEFRAVYNTEKLNGVIYDFKASDDSKAIEFAKWKFSAKNIVVINIDTCESTYMGDSDECAKIEQSYFNSLG